MLNILLVDDEELTIIELKYILEKFSDINICGIATTGKDALKKIIDLKPHVVFLDIHLNDVSGIKIAETVKELYNNEIKIIFVTAYDEYALKAFELNAVDYLLKPFSEERIKETITRLKDINNKNMFNNLNTVNKLEKILVEKKEKLKLIDIKDIIFIEAQGRHTLIYSEKNIYNASYSLKILEDKLIPHHFFKPHRSFLINLRKIDVIIPWFNGTYQLIMQNYPDKKITLTRTNVKSFKQLLGI